MISNNTMKRKKKKEKRSLGLTVGLPLSFIPNVGDIACNKSSKRKPSFIFHPPPLALPCLDFPCCHLSCWS